MAWYWIVLVFVVITIIVALVVRAKRPESPWGHVSWLTEIVCMILLPIIGGWILGPTPLGSLVGLLTTYVGDHVLWIGALPLIAVIWGRKESGDGEMTAGDMTMVIPAALFGCLLYTSTLGKDVRDGLEAANKRVEQAQKETAERRKQQAAEAKKLADNPPPPHEISAMEKATVKWDGKRTITLPSRKDVKWVVEGNFAHEPVLGSNYTVSDDGKQLTYRSTAEFPPGGPRVCYQLSDGKYSAEFRPSP